MALRSICVFCGARPGHDPAHAAAAVTLGRTLAEQGIRLVYGGGAVGLMGIVADAALAAGGEVIGIIPQSLEHSEIGHSGLTRLEVVADIQLRKARMNALADAFITLPGGYGTMDEMFEVLTWSQIGRHRKPAAFLNVDGYFDLLLAWIERAYQDHFIYEEHLDLYVTDASPTKLLEKLAAFAFPGNIERWLVR